MKANKIILAILLFAGIAQVSAQEVNTLYFLENAPMRHVVNPAFQPVSNGYVNFTPLGYTSLWLGNNSLTAADLIYTKDGKTITPLYPGEDRNQLMRRFRKVMLTNSTMSMDILSFGFRLKNEKGYVHINIQERMDMGLGLSKDLPDFLLNGGMHNLDGKMNTLNMTKTGMAFTAYTEIAGGYSHKINDQWTVGGKFKFLLGSAYVGNRFKDFHIDANTDQWHIVTEGNIYAAAPLRWENLPSRIDRAYLTDKEHGFDASQLLPELGEAEDIKGMIKNYAKLLKPSGYGVAVDLGFTYKPHPQVQITAAINDLGFIYWQNARTYAYHLDTTYVGVGDFEYDHYVDPSNGKFLTDSLVSDLKDNMLGLLDGAYATSKNRGFGKMLSGRLNVGVDANFWDNRIGVGVVSSTRLYNRHLYEELTLGAALRPCNWFNLALSYSLVNNGKFSNIGAGLSFMPYDGINLTLVMDYIPTVYGVTEINKKEVACIPYKTKGFNLAMGFSIVWGTNKKDKDSDKDGIYDKLDMCPNTPANVTVDFLGCPIDSDGDGVPDYLDRCPGTPEKAYGMVDENGCPNDEDGDGVPDYMDQCPGTPAEAQGMVDEKGCPLDTDEDGVFDYMDECPGTPLAAKGFVDEKGCLLDTDEDGVPDYMDECPNTPREAQNFVSETGCPLDTDHDGVPDYLDECPNTPEAAIGHVDSVGCPLDTDGDGIFDYEDECPTVAGSKQNKGCPEIKREIRTLLNKAMQGIQFETGKAVIKKASFPLLDQIAQVFIDNKDYIIEVQGHTDNTGSAELNKKLSDARAHSVMDYMIKKGVEESRLSAHGYGMEVPIADNATKAGRAKNRRVEFNITFEEVTYETVLDHADTVIVTDSTVVK